MPPASASDKLNQVLERLAVIGEQVKAVPDHETRIRALEQTHSRLIGAVLVVSAVFSGLGAWLGVLSFHH